MTDGDGNGAGQLPSEPAAFGDEGAPVAAAQEYLTRFGYLQATPAELGNFAAMEEIAEVAAAPAATPGTFDQGMRQAIESFQAFTGLPVTGDLDLATLAQMGQPRCGFPDYPTPELPADGGGGIAARFVAQGSRWPRTDLTYGFRNFTQQLSQSAQRTALVRALKLWSDASVLSFTEVPISQNPDIVIRFVSGEHGDGNRFDGRGNVLAHAFFPPPGGGSFAGDCHFDDAERWTVSVPVPAGTTDLVTVAAHEFGHSLGLAHSTIRAALMFPFYGGPHQFLDADDILGIRTIYGS